MAEQREPLRRMATNLRSIVSGVPFLPSRKVASYVELNNQRIPMTTPPSPLQKKETTQNEVVGCLLYSCNASVSLNYTSLYIVLYYLHMGDRVERETNQRMVKALPTRTEWQL